VKTNKQTIANWMYHMSIQIPFPVGTATSMAIVMHSIVKDLEAQISVVKIVTKSPALAPIHP